MSEVKMKDVVCFLEKYRKEIKNNIKIFKKDPDSHHLFGKRALSDRVDQLDLVINFLETLI